MGMKEAENCGRYNGLNIHPEAHSNGKAYCTLYDNNKLKSIEHNLNPSVTRKLPFGDSVILFFSFFKILTLNRNINSESFGIICNSATEFLGDFLHRKNSFGLLNPNLFEFLRHLYLFSS
jgi:hypothetical protein